MIIHIGLGKTGTTSLQRAIFPELLQSGCIESYNPPEVMNALRLYSATGHGVEALKEMILSLPDNSLISLESLAGWNPAFWKRNADRLKSVIPREATILITLRDPASYLTSVYLQMLHQGSVMSPDRFFLDKNKYQGLAPLARPEMCEIFSVDELNYRELISMYAGFFDKVLVVPVVSLVRLDFLDDILDLKGEKLRLVARFGGWKKENVSYSRLAVSLTLARSAIAGVLGVRFRNSHDRHFDRYFSDVDGGKKGMSLMWARFMGRLPWGWKEPWRFLMQRMVDKIFPYNKYVLPGSVSKGVHIADNVELYRSICAAEKGYLLLSCGDDPL